MKAVYIINGFLESGKTEFIQFTMQQPYLKAKKRPYFYYVKKANWNMMRPF